MILSIVSCKTGKQREHSYMQHVYMEMKDSFSDAEVYLLRDSIKVIFPDNIMFRRGESEVLEPFLPKLNRFSNVFNKYNRTNVLVTGHTDNTGLEEQNMKLSLERAAHVKGRMIENKVSPERIFTWGLGQKSPITTNDTEEGRGRNRRVEFVILFNSN